MRKRDYSLRNVDQDHLKRGKIESSHPHRDTGDWTSLKGKDRVVKEYFLRFLAYQVVQVCELSCPVERSFWNWIFQLFPWQTGIPDQQRFKNFDDVWLSFFLHKSKFFDSFNKWFINFGKLVYRKEENEMKRFYAK